MTAIARLPLAQRLCEEFGIAPTYVVDHPVVSDPESASVVREIAHSGRATVGAHLHPWVNPPYEEEVCARNSYPGNLGRDLEARKLRTLTAAIEAAVGTRPSVYRAGRYGIGPGTPGILEEQGFEVDLSPCPPFDFAADGGPDFSAWPLGPVWYGDSRGLLGVPATGAYAGLARRGAHPLYRLATRPVPHRMRLPGILARLRVVDRLHLSPEGYALEENLRLTRDLLRRGVRTFSFSFHSPSLEPGFTDYVPDAAELERFLDRCRRYFDAFLGELGGVAVTPLELKRQLCAGDAAVS